MTFRNVPLNIQNEEILHLCETYGKPLDKTVHYEQLFNDGNRGMMGGTRYVEMELFKGASLKNFYWMEGPLQGDAGYRITVLHPGQIQQCSHCLKPANSGCPGKGNGRACEATGTLRTKMPVYMEFVKINHGYRSLKARYFEQFTTLGGTGTSGLNDKSENGGDGDDDEILPKTPL